MPQPDQDPIGDAPDADPELQRSDDNQRRWSATTVMFVVVILVVAFVLIFMFI